MAWPQAGAKLIEIYDFLDPKRLLKEGRAAAFRQMHEKRQRLPKKAVGLSGVAGWRTMTLRTYLRLHAGGT